MRGYPLRIKVNQNNPEMRERETSAPVGIAWTPKSSWTMCLSHRFILTHSFQQRKENHSIFPHLTQPLTFSALVSSYWYTLSLFCFPPHLWTIPGSLNHPPYFPWVGSFYRFPNTCTCVPELSYLCIGLFPFWNMSPHRQGFMFYPFHIQKAYTI